MNTTVLPTPYDPVIRDIQLRFADLHRILNEREDSMVNFVQTLRVEYFQTPGNTLKQIEDLLELKEFIKERTRDNAIMEKKIADIDEEVGELKSQLSKRAKLNPVSWGSMGYHKLCQLLNEIQFEPDTTHPKSINASEPSIDIPPVCNKVVKTSKDRYKRMVRPVFQGGRMGDGFASDGICYPNHVSIDESTKNIYVSDFKQNCIVIFDNKANLINKFSSGIKFPRAITCKDRKLYLIENSHLMQHLVMKTFSLNPQIDLIPTKRIKPPSDMLNVSAFDISITGDWYICNRPANKIHCFSKNAFSTFITSTTVHHPTAIQVRQTVYVLESHGNQVASIKMITLQGVVLLSIPLYSIVDPQYFDIDVENNFIVSDSAQDSIVIFEKSGNLHHRITATKSHPLTHPKGVAISDAGNLVVVTNNVEGSLLIF